MNLGSVEVSQKPVIHIQPVNKEEPQFELKVDEFEESPKAKPIKTKVSEIK